MTNQNKEAQTVPVALSEGRSYDIHIGAGLLTQTGEIAGEVLSGGLQKRQAVIITQPKIAERYGSTVAHSLHDAGFALTQTVTFPDGESYKTLATVEELCGKLYDLPVAVDRKAVVIALGGGVVGDVAGFVASLYLRGLPYVQIPTTLLAMVDSSVGGKTGVDFKSGKNLIGAFHQPRSVVVDPDVLRSLPLREIKAGMAEVIKYGFVSDPEFLQYAVNAAPTLLGRDGVRRNVHALACISHIVRRSCEIKADIVTRDEFETSGLRALLNYGHTIGHALESATNYTRFRHGEAVGIGMMAAAFIGEARGITPPEIAQQTRAALQAYGLPTALPADINPADLIGLLGRDKKAEAGHAKFVLLQAVGNAGVWGDVSETMIHQGLAKASA